MSAAMASIKPFRLEKTLQRLLLFTSVLLTYELFAIKIAEAQSIQWPDSYQPDLSICNPQEYTVENFHFAPVEHFSSRIECNIGLMGMTVDAHETFDAHRGNIGIYERLGSDAVESRYIYNFHHQEIDEIFEDEKGTRLCRTTTMGSGDSTISGIFGFNTTAGNGGSGVHLFSLAGVLQIAGNYKYKEVTEDVVRGIPVKVYETCMPFEKKKGTLKVTFFWTNEELWTSPDDDQGIQVPVQIRVQGAGEFGDGGSHKAIDNYYDITDFFEFTPRETDFSPPPDTYCRGRKYHGEEANQWIPTDIFTQKAEILYWNTEDSEEHMEERTEFYDYLARYVRYDYVWVKADDDRRFMSMIHDFNTGHRYATDVTMGSCTISELLPESFDGTLDDQGHLAMVTPADLLQDYSDYAYMGRHFDRDIEAYVHTAYRSALYGLNMTFGVWTTSRRVLDESESEVGKPVPIRFTAHPLGPNAPVKPFEINIFEYQDTVPGFHTWDIRHCFNDTVRQWLRLILDGSDPSWDLQTLSHFFMHGAHLRIAQVADVVPIRVHGVWFDTNGLKGRIMIGFGLYERPEEHGALNVNPYPNATLKEAWDNLRKKVDSGDFSITVPYLEGGGDGTKPPMKQVDLFAIPGSLKSAEDLLNGKSTTDEEGYGSGDMAAMGICMLLIGIGCVVGFFFWLHKK